MRSTLAAAALLVIAACGEPPPDLVQLGSAPITANPTASQTMSSAGEWFQIFQTIEPDEWTPGPLPGVRAVRLVAEGNARSTDPSIPHRLAAPDGSSEFQPVLWSASLLTQSDFPVGAFTVVAGDLYVADPTGELTAKPLRYTGFFPQLEAGRFSLGGVTSTGWLMTKGDAVVLDAPDMDGPADLFFGVWAYGTLEKAGEATYAITLDGEVVHRETLAPDIYGRLGARRVALDLDGGGELAVRVEGGKGLLAIGAPRIVRSAWRAEREGEHKRQDLVLFVADTFRADNMQLHGGDPRWTPVLNEWAAGGRAYTAARATAPWTLPSHASMLTGLYPFQHGAISNITRISDELTTLAESLRAAGYRTIAVTDGIYLTEAYGMTQGFETFVAFLPSHEFEATTLTTIRELLKEDDGRPVFLYVQSYYAHTPYEPRAETRAKFPDLFDPELPPEAWEWRTIDAQLRPELKQFVSKQEASPEGRAILERIEALYRGGSHELDAWFGAVLDALDTAGYGDAVIAFTSDHGEAFGEHRTIYHGDSVHEEEVHVPLVLRGPGIAAGVVDGAVSLVDLAPTFAHLADIPPAPAWIGESLLAKNRSARPIGTFSTNQTGLVPHKPFAIYVDERKVIGMTNEGALEDGIEEAYTIASDPAELRSLATSDWARAVLEEWRAELDAWLDPRAKSPWLELSPTELENLEAMGYFGK